MTVPEKIQCDRCPAELPCEGRYRLILFREDDSSDVERVVDLCVKCAHEALRFLGAWKTLPKRGKLRAV